MAKKQKEISIIEVKMSPEEKLKFARELRLRKAGLTPEVVEQNMREEFRKYFVKVKRILNLPSDLEDILWLHLKAIKCDKVEKFNEGLKNFGYKI